MGTVHIVATPIGNLEDITLRALRVLGEVDLLLAEDTRRTRILLDRHGIRARPLSLHAHNEAARCARVLEVLAGGGSVALVSDAGTPLVSDPGFKLVRECRAEGLAVTAVPGPSAVLAALAASGLPSDRFCFVGFLPAKSGGRRRVLGEVARLQATLVFFESGPRLAASLADMAAVLGARPAAVTRELTKLHEEIREGQLDELAASYTQDGPPKGEITVVVAPPRTIVSDEVDLDAELRRTLAIMSLRDAVAEVAAVTGLPRRPVYSRALALAPGAGKLRGVH